ncbi:hypothetical protein [Derxia gummosa]|uniref:Uncharacterized protein n=1 Tax=Derxia gummosa DSM 723 TaxID=1121388 RepID=A0A8B6XCF1_9BURK|nr:hypothetical protein [Derxia gummosa]
MNDKPQPLKGKSLKSVSINELQLAIADAIHSLTGAEVFVDVTQLSTDAPKADLATDAVAILHGYTLERFAVGLTITSKLYPDYGPGGPL